MKWHCWKGAVAHVSMLFVNCWSQRWAMTHSARPSHRNCAKQTIRAPVITAGKQTFVWPLCTSTDRLWPHWQGHLNCVRDAWSLVKTIKKKTGFVDNVLISVWWMTLGGNISKSSQWSGGAEQIWPTEQREKPCLLWCWFTWQLWFAQKHGRMLCPCIPSQTKSSRQVRLKLNQVELLM